LAPILALVETQLAAETRRHVDVLFSARRPTDVYLRDAFRGWEKAYPTFQFRTTLTRSARQAPRARIPDVLPGLFPDLSGHLVFVAGSSGLVDACAAAAIACGALRYRVRTEAFFTEPQPWRSPAASPRATRS
jgi:CDP-4-dehydro-6-deoxyglucose reductase